MTEYRTHMKIIGDILATTRDDLQDEEGASVTYLIRKANVSHSRISRILKTLVSQGLLEQAETNGSNKDTEFQDDFDDDLDEFEEIEI